VDGLSLGSIFVDKGGDGLGCWEVRVVIEWSRTKGVS
jgi:hypothetical protein